MTEARLQSPWRRCGECGCVHAATICHVCKEPTPTIPVLVDDFDLEGEAVRASSAGGSGMLQLKVSSPFIER